MKDGTLQSIQANSYLSDGNAAYIEEFYEQYLNDPYSVPPPWRNYFDSLYPNKQHSPDISHASIREHFLQISQHPKTAKNLSSEELVPLEIEKKQAKVAQLVDAYRIHGHHIANLDPLGMAEPKDIPSLELSYYGLSEADFNTHFNHSIIEGLKEGTLREIVKALKETYCGTASVEYMYISDTEQVRWIQKQIEPVRAHPTYSSDIKRKILYDLTIAEGLEKYLGTRYVGQKRFSLEGGESLIPMLNDLIQRANHQGVKEIVLGMAHRGRLNVLINVLGKSPTELFKEFEGKYSEIVRSGDVKYHLGFSSDIKTSTGNAHLALAFNPSHLEIISPVVEGSVRARQQRRQDHERTDVVPLLLHGDSAFAGQGVVMETFNLSQARGFCVGGTIHVVINNQIGFTTSNPIDTRSTTYCTDIAKMVEAPVFHVNGDDPEAVVFVTQLALDFRMKFKKDVVIDLICYRRQGHNEADEPSATQPMMYKTIKSLPSVRKIYTDKLIAEGVVTSEQIDAMIKQYRDDLDAGKNIVETVENNDKFRSDWSPYFNQEWTALSDTRVDAKTLRRIANAIEKLPGGMTLQPQVGKMLEERQQMTAGVMPINWGYAETLAYATLLNEGYNVRLSGQDSGRGTFAHRHATLHDYQNGEEYVPLQHVSKNQGHFMVIDSILSEEAVLAFEYGYATTDPKTLVLWEAQFGDFANGAQVLVDQFISSGEQKWGRLGGLVMLLPHGYEGQGPEHSSARLERYLQLCAQHNMQVCTPTTPAQVFHMLRRQIIRPFRKPLIVMTPKSILRHKLAVSSLDELANGEFQLIIPEIDDIHASEVERVVLCCGKVFYDLLEYRRNNKIKNIAIIRIEQLYPFPDKELRAQLQRYKKVKKIVWCQEEPMNQGAWYGIQHNLVECIAKGQELSYAGRAASASPAVGYASLHQKQQIELVKAALE